MKRATLLFLASLLAFATLIEPGYGARLLHTVVGAAWAQQEPDDDDDDDRDDDDAGDAGDDDRGDDDAGDTGDDDRGDDDAGDTGDDDTGDDDADDAGDDDRGDDGDDRGREDEEDDAELAERGADDDLDGDLGRLAGGFDLDDTESFDDDGFLARRGEIIALTADAVLSARAVALGLTVIEQQPLPSFNQTVYRLAVPAGAPIDGILVRLRAQDPAGVFDRNHLYEGSTASATPLSNASAAHRFGALLSSAAHLAVGLVDTEVSAAHPALGGVAIEQRRFAPPAQPAPTTHGTAIASLLVGPESGLLPRATLRVASVFYNDRRGGVLCEAEDLVRALDWLMELQVPVINMSLSGPPNTVLQAAIARASHAGHLIIAAVGNAGPAAPPLYPAAYPGVVAVTAVDSQHHVYRRANRGAHVELAALGVEIQAAAPDGMAVYSGTSFASPYVTALAALDHRRPEHRAAQEVLARLRARAIDLGAPGRDDIYGYGLARPHPAPAVSP